MAARWRPSSSNRIALWKKRNMSMGDLSSTVLRSDNDDETNHNNKNISSSPTNSSSVTSTPRNSNSSGTPSSDHASSSPRTTGSPYAGGQLFSPWNVNSSHHPLSPYMKSPWIVPFPALFPNDGTGSGDSLIGSIVRQEGHVYSLAASGDVLYTGSESKNIRVWKNRSASGELGLRCPRSFAASGGAAPSRRAGDLRSRRNRCKLRGDLKSMR
ncbi:unnamed protein product [Linum trigynum]|uniref:Uncharacterized protein n=1 Tax=Linum trigynum TaxID=586398 RepID=A0AAV2FF82_9ROSI